MDDFDSPWKEALDLFLPSFLEFFFPRVHAEIDWNRKFKPLDQELLQIAGKGEIGTKRVDKLYQVWRPDGIEAWVVVHIEIQSQPDVDFTRRMMVYHYRLFDRHDRPIISLAVLGDDRPSWRPSEFRQELWGCEFYLKFLMVKLLDYGPREAVLDADPNPFGLVVLAHLQTIATRQDPASRQVWKTQLVKGLFDRGYTAEVVRKLFCLIDGMMDLPPPLEKMFMNEIYRYQEAKKMPYVTRYERIMREEGAILTARQMVGETLESKFGEGSMGLRAKVEVISDVALLRKINKLIISAATIEELDRLIPWGQTGDH